MSEARPCAGFFMAQFQKKSHPARDHLDAATRRWPGLWSACDDARKSAENPQNIYLTTRQVEACAKSLAATPEWLDATRQVVGASRIGRAQIFSSMTTLAAWRMTQGIYRIDPAVYMALVDTPITGDIPASVLEQLPEWCVYVETPDDPEKIRGFYARIDAGEQLAIMLDLERGDAICTAIPLRGALASILQNAVTHGADEAALPAASGLMSRIINLVMYICCSGYDIHGKRGQPGNPEPKRTRRDGWRLFAADGVSVWDVGVRMGAALRAAYHAAETGQHQGSSVRGHVRRAHWHGFRSGKRLTEDGTPIPAEKRQFELKWLPPIAVNLDSIDNLPATIKRVP